jgi:hypothetical protein
MTDTVSGPRYNPRDRNRDGDDLLWDRDAQRYGRWRMKRGISPSYAQHKAEQEATRRRAADQRAERLAATTAAEWLADRGPALP